MDFFDSAYRGTPPWDIGRPQKEFIDLVRHGEITGSVLDIGCGSGDNALFFAQEGFDVWGIDSSSLAIQKAREKSQQRGLPVHFQILNARELAKLNRTFDTATDSGLFHTLSDDDRPLFVKSLAAVLSPHGTYFMLCFSDREPGGYGPRRISEREIRETFSDGWSIRYIRPATFESNTRAQGPRAWLSSITKK
jgi:cyclopropane fatty-acyl-phospholipid synthase-like methyltransferase